MCIAQWVGSATVKHTVQGSSRGECKGRSAWGCKALEKGSLVTQRWWGEIVNVGNRGIMLGDRDHLVGESPTRHGGAHAKPPPL